MSVIIDSSVTDPIALARELIRCPSVTPDDAGAIGILEAALKPLGFECHRLRFEAAGTAPVENLYARIGNAAPNFCFAGHTDVVPPGDAARWRHGPFAADIEDGMLYGRGAADMKSAIAAFVAAVARLLDGAGEPKGTISLLITGDEEGPAVNGTAKVLDWLKARGERIDHCLVGEPTSSAHAGDTVKIGRRGSMNMRADVRGVQGHAAYPGEALNPIPVLAEFVSQLSALSLDRGTEHFDPSSLTFTSVDVGNAATNLIPGEAHAMFNIRFNDLHTPDSLMAKLEAAARAVTDVRGGEIALTCEVSGTAFVTKPGPYSALLAEAVTRAAGLAPVFSTGGGTSDARFIKDYCPVAELGLPARTMHKTDECASLADIELLTKIYFGILSLYFERPPT